MDCILSSPLGRARDTAAEIAHALGIPEVETVEELTEIDIGIFAGLTLEQARERHPERYRAFMQESWEGVPGAERIDALYARALAAWQTLIQRHAQGRRSVLAVTHSGFLQWIIRSTLGLAGVDAAVQRVGELLRLAHARGQPAPGDGGDALALRELDARERRRDSRLPLTAPGPDSRVAGMQVRILAWSSLPEPDRKKILARSEKDIAEVESAARAIIECGAGAAVMRLSSSYTRRFNGADLSGMPLACHRGRDRGGRGGSSPRRCARRSAPRSRTSAATTSSSFPPPMSLSEIQPGVYAGERATPIPSVGLYAPRGKGSFPSSMYMMAVPAQVAAVERVVVVSPPDAEAAATPPRCSPPACAGPGRSTGSAACRRWPPSPTARESIRPVAKFLGPGNQYVTAAKRLLAGVVDVGLPAGPSESMIIADASADPRLLALDLLIEAEHGPDSQAILVTPSAELARAVAAELALRAAELPEPRASYVRESFASYGCILTTSDIVEAAGVVNAVAPEHLQIATSDPLETLGLIRNAGEILLGQNTPFSLANYCDRRQRGDPDRRPGKDLLAPVGPGFPEVFLGCVPDRGRV